MGGVQIDRGDEEGMEGHWRESGRESKSDRMNSMKGMHGDGLSKEEMTGKGLHESGRESGKRWGIHLEEGREERKIPYELSRRLGKGAWEADWGGTHKEEWNRKSGRRSGDDGLNSRGNMMGRWCSGEGESRGASVRNPGMGREQGERVRSWARRSEMETGKFA